MLVKVCASGRRFVDAARRMERALREFRVRGVKTNVPFLLNVIRHPDFLDGRATTRFLDDTPDLFRFPVTQDRATKLLTFMAEVTVNGFPTVPKAAPEDAAVLVEPVPPHLSGRDRPAGRARGRCSSGWGPRSSPPGSGNGRRSC